MNNAVLVVGGAGYIGSHTVLALKDAGFLPVVYDNFSSGHRDACFGDHLVEGDLTDTAKLVHTMQQFGIGSVIHFAALIEAGQSVVTPLPFFQNNVAGTLSLLEAMNTAGVPRLVFSSTAAVYGNLTDVALLSEELPRAPINPYGDSKAMVETVLESCVSAYGLQAIALRYFNASGADAQGRSGERHDPETHLIPLVIQAAQGRRDRIKVYGADYDTPDGTCIRDYIHVSDLASGHVAALRHLLGRDAPGVMPVNLGTGQGQSVRQVIDAVRRVSGRDFIVEETPRRAGDPATLVADVRRAADLLGWAAVHSDLDTIARDAWAYAQASG
ncbi:UDP-glucose 4-epimerase GalE [Sulfitobacter guttiformis]|uniref:UDP-glucose 4-epimerase n=1 Tax=Sulfitobacter guttiformis TaxID=74349 RepID=J7FY06_9RHOB|nr:UDP-glucose 4-epimerase GalE [Sulfitobacter guttiformis]AFP55480.1 UDP-glucose 4-epimerase [Sulfitobacter guttiformis]KIN75506.1 UDP-glucose 4-epimerase [Sulfitobacter guttiformis KCTC 32187]RKE92102.1 UDP-glucose 4-epimerase [Sulfitobacter guttiformis]